MPESVPDSEEERAEQANMLVVELRNLGPDAWNELTTFEVEVLSDLNDGKACTRVRFKIIREAAARIKKKFSK